MKMNILNGRVVLLIIALVLTPLGFWAYTQAAGGEIRACVNTSGAVYIIGEGFKKTACAKGEQLLSWNTVGPKGDKGDTGEQGLPGPKGDKGDTGSSSGSLHVFDANNQDLGVLISIGDVSNLSRIVSYLPDLGVFLDFRQDSAVKSIFMNHVKTIYFPSDNCTGNPYSTATENPGATIVNNSGRVFKYTNQPLVQGNDSWSRLGSICENGQGLSQLYAPLVEVPLPFTLPPAWPLEVR